MAITAAQLMVRVGADVSDADRGLKSVSDRLGAFGKQAALTGGVLTAGVTLPLIAVAKGALNTAMSYEDALKMMQAVSGATAAEMRQVADAAKALGADMTLPAASAADAATAMVELAKAGLSVNEALGAAQGVLQMAAAGQLSNAQAAEIAATALNAFSLEGSEATRVADLLAAAANASSGEVTDVADSLKMSAAVFAAANIPIEVLIASIGQMANAGIQGSDAGTSLKQMLLRLQAPTDKSAALMAALGINIYDAQGAMLPFSRIIEQFTAQLSDVSQEQRNASLATIFGSDAVRAANIVMMGGVEAHEQMLDAVTRQGAAADLAGTRMKGLGGALQGIQSQVETVLLEVAMPFLSTLEGWARALAELIPRITELDPNIRNAALAFAAVLAAAGPVLVIVGALSGALAFLISPVGLVVAAVAGLAAAWASNFLGIRDVAASVFAELAAFWAGTLQPVLTEVVAWLGENIPIALQALSGFWQTVLLPALTNVWAFIQADLIPLFVALWDLFSVVGDLVITALAGLWQNVLLPALTVAWEFIRDSILPIFQDLIDRVEGPLGTALLWLRDNVLVPVRTALGDISGAFQTAIDRIGALTDSLSAIRLPAWLTPRSPTPFEIGLLGIGEALSKLNRIHLPEFETNLNVRAPTLAGLGANGLARGGGRGDVAISVDVHVSGEGGANVYEDARRGASVGVRAALRASGVAI